MSNTIVIKTQEIKAGDQFRHEGRGWDALADANKQIPMTLAREMKHYEVAVKIRHVPDGGQDYRLLNVDNRIEIIREEPKQLPARTVRERREAREAEESPTAGIADAQRKRHLDEESRAMLDEATKAEKPDMFEKIYDDGYKAGVLAVIERIERTDDQIGPHIRKKIAARLVEIFKSEGKI